MTRSPVAFFGLAAVFVASCDSAVVLGHGGIDTGTSSRKRFRPNRIAHLEPEGSASVSDGYLHSPNLIQDATGSLSRELKEKEEPKKGEKDKHKETEHKNTDIPPDECVDGSGTFKNHNGRNKPCTWLTTESRRNKNCHKYEVSSLCLVQCRVCDTYAPTSAPTSAPTKSPTASPSAITTTKSPTSVPTKAPMNAPTDVPTKSPTDGPTKRPSDEPTKAPTDVPTNAPTDAPTDAPTRSPTGAPTNYEAFTVGFSVAMERTLDGQNEESEVANGSAAGRSAKMDVVQNAVKEVLSKESGINVVYDDNLGDSGRFLTGHDSIVRPEDMVNEREGDNRVARGTWRVLDQGGEAITLRFNEEESIAVIDTLGDSSQSGYVWHTYLLKYDIIPCTANGRHGRDLDASQNSGLCDLDASQIGYQAETVVMESVEDGRMLELLQLSDSGIVGVSEIGEEVQASSMFLGEENPTRSQKPRGFEPLDTEPLDPLRIGGIILFLTTSLLTFVIFRAGKRRRMQKDMNAIWGSVLGSESDVNSFLKAGKAMEVDTTSTDTPQLSTESPQEPAKFQYGQEQPLFYT